MKLGPIILASCLILALLVECSSNRNLYRILGINNDASEAEIKQRFRILAKKLHPDKNKGDKSAGKKFQDLREAFNVLSDPNKRSLYDEGGEELVNKMGNDDGSVDPFESFADLFGFGRPPSQGHEKAAGADVTMVVEVTYEELYSGSTVQLERVKPIYIAADGIRKCKCKLETVTRQVSVGFLQMTQHEICQDCPNKDLTTKSHLLDLDIRPGTIDGSEQKFYGEGEAHIDGEPGDLIVKIRALQHSRFERKGDHLYTNCTISLQQALMGFSLIMVHLDRRHVIITSDHVVWPGAVAEKLGEGMPVLDRGLTRGNLYITYDIEFPRGKLRNEARETLRQSLASFDRDATIRSRSDTSGGAPYNQKPLTIETPIRFYNGL